MTVIPPTDVPARVTASPLARVWLRRLADIHGPLLLHQSGGCCDGSAPMCYPRAEFTIGARDVHLGWVDDVPVYIGDRQYEYWQHTALHIDVVPGRGSGFSLEAPEGIRFLTRSRVFADAEWHALVAAGEPARGPAALEARAVSSRFTSPT